MYGKARNDRLGFPEAAAAAFSFLMSEYGFRCTLVSETEVRYESDLVIVSVLHTRPSLELGVEIGLLEDESHLDSALRAGQSEASIGRPTGEYQFSLDEVASLAGVRGRDQEAFAPFAATAEEVASQLPRLAAGLRHHAAHLLRGAHNDFEDLAVRRTADAQVFTRRIEVAQARSQADAAWRARDLASVIEHLSRLGDALTPAERKKLQYARAHVTH